MFDYWSESDAVVCAGGAGPAWADVWAPDPAGRPGGPDRAVVRGASWVAVWGAAPDGGRGPDRGGAHRAGRQPARAHRVRHHRRGPQGAAGATGRGVPPGQPAP